MPLEFESLESTENLDHLSEYPLGNILRRNARSKVYNKQVAEIKEIPGMEAICRHCEKINGIIVGEKFALFLKCKKYRRVGKAKYYRYGTIQKLWDQISEDFYKIETVR